MGDVLAELEGLLRSRPNKDSITTGEEKLLYTCKAKAIRSFTVGACASSAVMWAVTGRLTHGQRFNLSVVSSIIAGMWRFNSSLNSCVDQILGLEGSRMQFELANIILAKHRDNSSKVLLVRKYFYPEQVFNDMNPDKPFYRWRPRYSYADNNALQRTEETEDNTFHEKSNDKQKQKLSTNTGGDMSSQKRPVRDMNVYRSPSEEFIADPLECVFGHQDTRATAQSDKASPLPRRRLRAHKRAHRRQRSQNAETAA